MGLGARLEQWLASIPPFTWLAYWFPGLAARFRQGEVILAEYQFSKIPVYRLDLSVGILFWFLVYVVSGVDLPRPSADFSNAGPQVVDMGGYADNPQKWIHDKLVEIGKDPQLRATLDFFGDVVTTPVLTLLEEFAAKENPDPHEFSRRFHGIATGLPYTAKLLDNALRIPLGEHAPEIGKSIDQIYWGLGIGFLGWQTLAPLLGSGLQPPLERYYNKLYRPARFTPTQARDVFALGIWDANQMQAYLQELGWRDSDIQTWLEVSYRDVSEGILWDMWELGKISRGDLERRLRKQGYNPDDLPLLFQAHEKADTNDAQKYLLSTAKAALKKHLISEAEFREILTGLKYAPQEIELQVAIIRTQATNEQRELTTGQIKELYNTRVIGRSEAIANLVGIEYDQATAGQLVDAWDVEALPKAARLNRSTITEAYAAGVLARSEALNLLTREAGYTPTNAELIMKVEDAQLRGVQGETPTEGTAVPLSTLIDFAQSGLINRNQFLTRAELARFTTEDRQRLAELAFTAPVVVPKQLGPDVLLDAYRRGTLTLEDVTARLTALGVAPVDIQVLLASLREELGPSVLARAYVAGVMDRLDFVSRLRGAGLAESEAEIFARTVELENPEVFGEFRGRFIKRASVGSLQLALQRKMITEIQFRERLTTQGYSQDAVEVYLFNAQYQAPASPKQLSKADILSLYQNQQFNRSQALVRLQQIGYTIEDATLLVDQREVAIEDTDIGRAYLNGYIDQLGAAAALSDEGWSFEEIENFFTLADSGGL